MQKVYRALVVGRPPDTGRADLHLAVTRHRPSRVEVVPADRPGARATGLSWRVLDAGPRAVRVEVSLETGFLHQIRAVFAHLGHPVLGDRVYGAAAADMAPRQMLHAWRLSWQNLEAQSPEPKDFRAVARKQGL